MPNEKNTAAPVSKEQEEFLYKLRQRKILVLIARASILIIFFALWEIAASLKWIDPFIFSCPTRILSAAYSMSISGQLFKHIGVTLLETIIGFSLSTLFGIIIAIILWWNGFLEKVLNPYLVIFNSLPKTALAPIIIVWIGNNEKSIIATAVMTSIIITIMTVLSGFLQVDKNKIKLIKTFNGTKIQILKKVILPASMPSIMNALRINIGLSFVGVIVGEFLVAKSGLGYLIVYGSQIFKMDWVMLSVITLCVLSAIIYQCIVIFEKKFNNWGE